MASPNALSGRRALRDSLLAALIAALRADDRFVAAWLGGSLGRGEGDALSDLDLYAVVTDATVSTLCARPWNSADHTTPDRLAVFEYGGRPAVIWENQGNAPAGGSWTGVVYATGVTVDWVLTPQVGAVRPIQTRLLFDAAGIPLQEPPPPLSPTCRAARASERVAYVWMMLTIVAKYIVRGDHMYVAGWLNTLHRIVGEIEGTLAGATTVYRPGSLIRVGLTASAQIAAARHLCERLEAASRMIMALGGTAPDRPADVIETVLALVEDRTDVAR